jgi:hypothetical protein
VRRREVNVGQEPGDIGDQGLHGFGIRRGIVLGNSVYGGLAGRPALRIHHLVQGPFGLGLEPRRELVQHVGHAGHPAAWLPRLRPDLAACGPAAKRPVADRQGLGWHAVGLEVW